MTATPETPAPVPVGEGRANLVRRFMRRSTRENLWAFLDLMDAKPALKRTLLIGVPAFLVLVGFGTLGYQRWTRTNSIHIARQWLDAGRLDRAAIAVRDALATSPDVPAPWRLASELAWRKGNRSESVDYAQKAAAIGSYQTDDVLAWAEASILADDIQQAKEAEGFLDPDAAHRSSRAQRIAGEIARRDQKYSEARDRFQAALKVDAEAGLPAAAIDEIPLGIVSLQTGSDDDRTRGQVLLAKWSTNLNWGVDALRALLADAVAHKDRAATSRWADALRLHRRCTLGDVPVCLKALSESNPDLYQEVLAPLEERSRQNPTAAAQLMGWLTQIGQGKEAIRWSDSLAPEVARKPPVAPAIAEALRSTRAWADLQTRMDKADWGPDVGFLGWAYAMVAARELGDGPKADAYWQSLLTNAHSSAAHALFAGESLYAWGYPKESAELLWAAADRPDLAFQALGSLARLYQMQRDSVGQYRAFSRLNAMRPDDRKIANNLAYFAALTDLGSQVQIERIAAANYSHEPGNLVYRSTYAFVLVCAGQASRAMKLLDPVSHEWRKSPALAFAYGATLASLGRVPEARQVFNTLNPGDLDPREIEWIRTALH
jgi:hypothetical protein